MRPEPRISRSHPARTLGGGCVAGGGGGGLDDYRGGLLVDLLDLLDLQSRHLAAKPGIATTGRSGAGAYLLDGLDGCGGGLFKDNRSGLLLVLGGGRGLGGGDGGLLGGVILQGAGN